MRPLVFVLMVVAATAAMNAAIKAPMAAPAQSDEVPIQAFYGEFEGRTLFPMGEPRNRELSVRIAAAGRFGFTMEWRTTIHKTQNEAVERNQLLEFEPTPRPEVYTAVSRADGDQPAAVGGLVGGAPYAWARINGRTLTVNVLTIEDNGDYVVQTYDRTLTNKGMVLEFMRMRNGHIEQQIKGNLNRVGG